MEGERFTKTAIWLHWLIAIGVITNIVLAWILTIPASAAVAALLWFPVKAIF